MPDEGIDEASFKRSGGGWIFKPGNPLLLGPSRYYYVTCAQKAAIAEKLRSWRVARAAATLAIIFLAPQAAADLTSPEVSAWMAAGVALLCVYAFLASIDFAGRRRLRPLLSGLPRAAGKITLREQFQALAKHVSFPLLSLFFAVFASSLILVAALAGHRPILAHGLAMLDYGLGALVLGVLIIAKLAARSEGK